jgi:tetratricopeptide (TPR) repeat protein
MTRNPQGILAKGTVLVGVLGISTATLLEMQQFFIEHLGLRPAPSVAGTAPDSAGTRPPGGSEIGTWRELYSKGQSLYAGGKYDEAYKVWGEALKLAEPQLADTTLSGAPKIEMLQDCALMYKTQQKPAQAARMYEQAVQVAVVAYGKDNPQVARIMLDLGRMYIWYDQIRSYPKAEEVLLEAFRINEKQYGLYTIPTGDVAMALAQLEEKRANYQKAIYYHKLVIKIGDMLEPNTISCCRIGPRQGLAKCYEAIASYDEALKVHEDLVAMARKGATNMLSTIWSNYSTCLLNAGRPDDAKRASTEAQLCRQSPDLQLNLQLKTTVLELCRKIPKAR